jgi:hypothetical protein
MKLFKYVLFISALTIFGPFMAMQPAKAGKQEMPIIMDAFQQLGVSAETAPDINPDIACATISVEELDRKFVGRRQGVCVEGTLGRYTINTTVYKHTGDSAFPNDIAFKLLKLAATSTYGEFSISPRNASKSQVAAIQIYLTQPEAEKALADAIRVIAVTGDVTESRISNGDQF